MSVVRTDPIDAEIHGGEVKFITVKMIGRKDVSEYFKKVAMERAIPPPPTFQVRQFLAHRSKFTGNTRIPRFEPS